MYRLLHRCQTRKVVICWYLIKFCQSCWLCKNVVKVFGIHTFIRSEERMSMTLPSSDRYYISKTKELNCFADKKEKRTVPSHLTEPTSNTVAHQRIF